MHGFALPDYGEGTIPPVWHTPSNRVDALTLHMMHKLMADSYVEGRKYWADHGGPNESQAEVEKFLEFTALLPKRERPELVPESDEEESSSTSSDEFTDEFPLVSAKARPRWKRILSLPSSSAPLLLKPTSTLLRSASLPFLRKNAFPKRLRRLSKSLTPPALRRIASEPTKSSSLPADLKRIRSITLDESKISIATCPDTDLSYNSAPSSSPLTRIPRFPCDYLPKTPIKSPAKTRRRRRLPLKQIESPSDSLAILIPVDTLPLSFDREPPPGSPLSIRKIPRPPPEWFDTPYPDEGLLLEVEEVEEAVSPEENIRWDKILLGLIILVFAIFVTSLLGILFLTIKIIDWAACLLFPSTPEN
ncbi:hypothetical protein BDP27DRAFT_1526023 [Rhodocollybia butyracea]|uniref:Uncharacterized protein n=1 Tax=Rhodocollybia butyracea TaxID=206335 RepID=A0A9P5P4F4_9AGAR|nr:hypothetical protein BDP27DRAFT_1526023 [Rhodocollybia butyracea]